MCRSIKKYYNSKNSKLPKQNKKKTNRRKNKQDAYICDKNFKIRYYGKFCCALCENNKNSCSNGIEKSVNYHIEKNKITFDEYDKIGNSFPAFSIVSATKKINLFPNSNENQYRENYIKKIKNKIKTNSQRKMKYYSSYQY